MAYSILVVEDESILADNHQNVLEALGYHVSGVVSTGEDAIIHSKKYNPNLVLMDISLNGKLDGIEAACEIRREKSIPVIYVTGDTDSGTYKRAKLSGTDFILHKPVTIDDLKLAIEKALE